MYVCIFTQRAVMQNYCYQFAVLRKLHAHPTHLIPLKDSHLLIEACVLYSLVIWFFFSVVLFEDKLLFMGLEVVLIVL
jgi:hypothetical protein